MRAIEAARRPLRTVPPATTLVDVAELMATTGLRALVVAGDDGRAAGIVTERDLVVRGLARRVPPGSPVEAVMTPDPVTADASTPVGVVYRLLHEHGVRQVPLVEQGRVVAVLDLSDLADETASRSLAAMPRCPHCDGNWLRPVTDAQETTNFLCLQCRLCWHLETGAFVPVDADACPGCLDHNFCRFPAIDYGVDTGRLPSPGPEAGRT